MPFKPVAATPQLTPTEIALISQNRITEAPIEFSANNPKSTDINRSLPIMSIKCRLTGTYTVTGSSATLTPYGIAELIQRLTLMVDGDQELISVPGFQLRTISHAYTGTAPYIKQPAVVVGSDTFEMAFTIPVDVGSYFSLLDASLNNRVTLVVQWGDVADMATPGTGHSLSGVQLNVNTLAVAGGSRGKPGGVGFGYMQHRIISLDQPITAAQSDLIINLNHRRMYSAFYLFSISDGSPVNTILNNARMKIVNNVLQKQLREDIEAENLERYNLASKFTGIHIFDLVRGANMDHAIMTSRGLEPEVVLDVAKPGTTDTIHVVSDYLVPPTAVAA